jgi:hypothetical protein
MENWKPFSFLFEKFTPDEFARVFEQEAAQAKAFLLSFSPGPEYAEAVLDYCRNDELTELVTKYVSQVETESVNAEFVYALEIHIKEIIGRHSESLAGVRKNMVIKKAGNNEANF